LLWFLVSKEYPVHLTIPVVPRRRRSSRRPLLSLATAALATFALSACESPVEPTSAPESEPAAQTALLPSTPAVPIPAALQGCRDAVTYDTGDPAYPQAVYQICWPAEWNGSFIVYGHGYVSEFEPLAIPSEAAELAPFVLSQHFAFASTSYRTNGLAIRQGVEDITALAGIVRAEAAGALGYAAPVPVLVAGASEGGAVATLAAEQHPYVFQGGLSTCGPTGDFQAQLDYLGDFNVLFNYFFPDVFAAPGGGFLVTPAGVAQPVIDNWMAFALAAQSAVLANPQKAAELLTVARVAVDPGDPASAMNAIAGLLWYNVFATNDAIAKLGGRPFDNRWRWYRGSSNDFRLNRLVERFRADWAAKSAVAQYYQTSGDLDIPYVSLHTTGDEIVRFWQQPRYRWKALVNGSAIEHSALPILRYGHCNFEEGDLTAGLGLLMLKVGAANLTALGQSMPSASARSTFQDLVGR
jgi:hypothetical protein